MRVLVAEDHRRLAEAVAAGPRDEGMAVDVVLDGQDALDHVALTRYDVLVLDRDLPGLYGDEVCKALAAGHAHHPGPARRRPARPGQLPGRHRGSCCPTPSAMRWACCRARRPTSRRTALGRCLTRTRDRCRTPAGVTGPRIPARTTGGSGRLPSFPSRRRTRPRRTACWCRRGRSGWPTAPAASYLYLSRALRALMDHQRRYPSPQAFCAARNCGELVSMSDGSGSSSTPPFAPR